MAKESLSKEELIEQLKALSESETPESVHMGAMCYSPAPPQTHEVKCESCGKIVEGYDWERSRTGIIKTVEEIRKLGYGAKVETVCAACAAKLGVKKEDGNALVEGRLYNVFYFKTKVDEHYHVAESSDEDEYEAVLAYLKKEPTYADYYGATRQVKDELNVIKRMTGISGSSHSKTIMQVLDAIKKKIVDPID